MRLHATITGREPGSALDIVLLHGLFGSGRNLGVIARGLAGRFRVIALDLRNHGASSHAADMRYPTMAADVVETLESLGVSRAAVIGHSMGGKTAMMTALLHPALVARLAVLDIAPIAYHHEHDGIIAALRDLALSPGLTRQAADAALSAAIPDAALRGFLLNNLVTGPGTPTDTRRGAMPHWRLGLAGISAAMDDLVGWPDPASPQYRGPALFLRGATSSYVPLSADEAIHQYFSAATIITIEGAGHWLHAEQPAAVVAALIAFLA
ncbi:alpha/beta fold hydrolase [Acidiphilium sp.]|uniref:alpha/beta fold hydrolase n=1 Tax=Acidiphilium sp. TaxID=527 RepID=UPI003CFEB903